MKKIKQDTVITGLVENRLTGETYEISAAPQDGTFHAVLPQYVYDDMVSAGQGDSTAWGRLYQVLSSYLASGLAVPQELGTFMAKRTLAIGDVLLLPQGDRRRVLPSAVAPNVKRGRKKEKLDLEEMLAIEALQIAGDHPSEETLQLAVEKVISLLPRKTDLKTPSEPFTKVQTLPIYSVNSILIKAKKRLF